MGHMKLIDDVIAYATSLFKVATGVPRLSGPFFQIRFLEEFISAIDSVFKALGARSVGIGTLIIVYMIKVLSTDVESAVTVLVTVVMRELGPMFVALLVLLRLGPRIATDSVLFAAEGRERVLRAYGMDAEMYLLVPRSLACGCATLLATIYFQVLAVGGGSILSALWLDISLIELYEHTIDRLTLGDIGYTSVKSFFLGMLIAVSSMHHTFRLSTARNQAEMVSRSMMGGLAAMMLFNALFAYATTGILLFGIFGGRS